MSAIPWHYGPRVVLPRRVKADLVDEAIAAAILFGPLLLGQALAGSVPDLLLRVTIVAIPAAILYAVFRDAVGGEPAWASALWGSRSFAWWTGGAARRSTYGLEISWMWSPSSI